MAVSNIILVGFMGTGKSTVAALLAERLGWTRIDLDAAIEQMAGMTITEMFAQHGEPFFRAQETEALLHTLQAQQPCIVATGGGAVLAAANREAMLAHGLVVGLSATEGEIVQRVKDDPNRPLLQGGVEERVRTLLAQRRDAYAFAPVQIDTTGQPVEHIVDQIIAALEQLS